MGQDSTEKEIDFQYPENTPGFINKDGTYWHGLSEKSSSELSKLESMVAEKNIDLKQLCFDCLDFKLVLLRYLRANNFNSEKAFSHIESNIEWRKEMNVTELVKLTPEEILGCEMPELTEVFPHWHFGYDKTGRPVLYKQYGKFDAGLIKKLMGGDFDKVVKYHVWEQEACSRLCLAKSRETKTIIETNTGVVDVKDMKLFQITKDFLNLTKLLANVDQNQYPETLGRIFILNTPSVFPFVWRMVKPWLDPIVTAKIFIFGGPKDYEPALIDFIGKENLPVNYGGDLPELSPLVHPYAETLSKEYNERTEMLNKIKDDKLRQDQEAIQLNSASIDPVRSLSFDPRSEGHVSPTGENSTTLGHPTNEISTEEKKSPFEYISWFFNESYGKFVNPFYEIEEESDASVFEESIGDDEYVDANEIEVDLENAIHRESSTKYKLMNETDRHSIRRKKPAWQHYLNKLLNKIVYPSLAHKSLSQIELFMKAALILFLFSILSLIILTSIVINSNYWSSQITLVQMWIGVTLLLLSSLIVLFSFIGYIGLRKKNIPLLITFSSCMFISIGIFFSVSIACFLYYFVPNANGLGDAALRSTFPDDDSRDKAKDFIKKYNLSLAIGSLIVGMVAIFPLEMSLAAIQKIKLEIGKRIKTYQIQYQLKLLHYICLGLSLVMITYGATCVDYLLNIRYMKILFTPFGVLYSGVFTMLNAYLGNWVSKTNHANVVRFFTFFTTPLLVFNLLYLSVLSFYQLNMTDQWVDQSYSDFLTQDSQDTVKMNSQKFLLVCGILCVFVNLFEFISLMSSISLSYKLSLRDDDEFSVLRIYKLNDIDEIKAQFLNYNFSYLNESYWSEFTSKYISNLFYLHFKLNREVYLVAWGIINGIFNLFFLGTFAIFGYYLVDNSIKSNWIFGLWSQLGQSDKRFSENDPFLVTSCGILAVLVGPLSLCYAKATYIVAPYRHILGIVCSALLITFWLIFYGIEIHRNLVDLNAEHQLVYITLIFSFVFYLLIPSLILYRESYVISKKVSSYDSSDMILKKLEVDHETRSQKIGALSQLSTSTGRFLRNRKNAAIGVAVNPEPSIQNAKQPFNGTYSLPKTIDRAFRQPNSASMNEEKSSELIQDKDFTGASERTIESSVTNQDYQASVSPQMPSYHDLVVVANLHGDFQPRRDQSLAMLL